MLAASIWLLSGTMILYRALRGRRMARRWRQVPPIGRCGSGVLTASRWLSCPIIPMLLVLQREFFVVACLPCCACRGGSDVPGRTAGHNPDSGPDAWGGG